MGDKGLLVLKIIAGAATFIGTTVGAVVVYKDPNKISDIIKEAIKVVKN